MSFNLLFLFIFHSSELSPGEIEVSKSFITELELIIFFKPHNMLFMKLSGLELETYVIRIVMSSWLSF